VKRISTDKLIYAAGLTALASILGAIWKWCPSAITQITSETYLPHGMCYLWNKQLLTLHAVSDSIICLSYLSISFSLAWLLYQLRRKTPFNWIFIAFGAFILACGFTHAMDVVVLWRPLYWLSGDMKLITSVVSLTTAVALPRLFPGIRQLLDSAERSKINASRFLAISESSNDGFYLFEAVRDVVGEIVDFRFAFLNDKGARLISSTVESMQGQLLCVKFPVNRTNGLFEEYKHVVETGERLDLIYPFDVEEINATWLHLQAIRLNDGLAITTQNVSDLQVSKQKLAETSACFRSLVEGVKDHAMFTVDAAGLVTSWNRGAERLFGYSDTEIVGRDFSCLMATEDNLEGSTAKLMDTALLHGRAEADDWGLSAQGTRFYANVNVTSLEDPGMNAGFAVVVQDMTERRTVAIAKEAVQQERMGLREKFLSHVSHELRTPLTAAYFFVTNVLDGLFGDLNPEQHEHLSHGVDNLDQLTGMVGDLLEITRSETHKLSAVAQRVSPSVLSVEALSTCRRNAVAADVQLTSLVPPDLPFLWADPGRVRQILINLLDNGIKFTPAGGTVSLSCASRVEDEGFLCFSVTDTGYGISQENLELVFDRLAQVESPLIASRSGLGLGLHIAKELVTLHGGRIWVESQLGRGSTFLYLTNIFP
jgi:PAS domain S-box-containing protein